MRRSAVTQNLSTNVLLTCTDCQHSYEPTPEDFESGRTGCPDPDCGGWTMIAETITVTPVVRTRRQRFFSAWARSPHRRLYDALTWLPLVLGLAILLMVIL
jgi:hypothetical protein